MRFNTLLYGTLVFSLATPFTQAAPLGPLSGNELAVRASIPKLSVPKAPAAAPKGGSSSSSSGGLSGLLGKLTGGGKTTPPKDPDPAPAPAPPKDTPAPAPPKDTPAPPKDTPKPTPTDKPTPTQSKDTAPVSSKPAAQSSEAAPQSSKAPTSASSSAPAASSSAADSCPLYVAADAIDISSRDIEKRAKEEYWFRYEIPADTTGGTILPLAARPGAKDFDDQAYKWISTDVSKITRGTIKGRLSTVHVLPAGTRDTVLKAAKDFETTSGAQQRADFVTKTNEPNDVGIQGVSADGSNPLPLDDFRNKVIRTVVKQTSTKAGGKATFKTITKGKTSNTASKDDQAALAKFC